MTKVKLYGALRERFGKEYDFDIVTPREALCALRGNFPDFTQYLIKNNEPGYYVFVDGHSLSPEKMVLPAGSKTIHIVPVIKGARKSPFWTIVIGIALVAVGGPLGLLGTGYLATAAVGMGVSLALQGISSLLAGNPGGRPDERPEQKLSTFFSGPINTIQQGGSVPLVYGEVIAGSAVISAGIETFRRGGTTGDSENCVEDTLGVKVCLPSI